MATEDVEVLLFGEVQAGSWSVKVRRWFDAHLGHARTHNAEVEEYSGVRRNAFCMSLLRT